MQCETHFEEHVGLVISDVIICMTLIHASNNYEGTSLVNDCQLACKNRACVLVDYCKMVCTYVHQPASKPLGSPEDFARCGKMLCVVHAL